MTREDADRSFLRTPAARALRVFDFVIDAGAVLAATLLIVVMVATTVNVFFRYGLGRSLTGIDQISGMLLLYTAFLGAAWVLRRDEHVVIDLLLGRVRPRTRWRLAMISTLIGAAVCLMVAVFGTVEVVNSIQRGVRIPAEIELPRAANLIVIPIGFLLLALQFIRRAVELFKGADAAPPPLKSPV